MPIENIHVPIDIIASTPIDTLKIYKYYNAVMM